MNPNAKDVSKSPKSSPKLWKLLHTIPQVHLHKGRGFEEEPLKLPRYALDCFVLAKVCRQMFSMIKDNLPEEKWEYVFPIKPGSLACNTIINASTIESDLLNLNLRFYHETRNFNNKNFAKPVLGLGD